MNEELLQKIYSKYGADKGTYEQFSSDMQLPEVRRKVYDKYLTGKGSYEQFESDLGVGQSVQADVQPQPEPEREDGGLYNLVGKIPVIGGLIQKVVDAVPRGINQGASLSEGVNALTEGKGLDDVEVQAISQILQQNLKDAEGDNSITAKFMRDESLSVGEWFGLAAETVVQSGAMIVRGAFDAITNAKSASILAGGAGTGAAAAAPLFGVGTLAGGVAGTLGSVSGMVEASSMYFDELQKELNERNLPINATNVRQIISDEEWLSNTRKRAAVKGIVVGGVDAVTAGIAAKIGKNIPKAIAKAGAERTAARKIIGKEVGKGLGVEIAGGFGGEMGSQAALGDKLDWKSGALEGIGEILPGFVSVYSGYYGSEGAKQIAEAKRIRTEAEKTDTPITSEVKTNSEKTLNIGHLVDAYKANDLESAKTALAYLATVHKPEDIDGMLQVMAKTEGISAEDVGLINAKFEETYAAAQKFNTPELKADPERTSRAVKGRLDADQVKAAKAKLEEDKAASDISLHPKYDEQIAALDTQEKELEETITAIVAGKQLEVSDDPVFYKTRLEELETVKATVRNESSAKTNELLEIGAVLQDNISSAILETYGSDEATTTSPSQKVLYDGVEYDVTTVNKNGSFDLSSRDGKFVKGAEKTDAEWQGFVGEEPTTTPAPKKEKKPTAVTKLEKAIAGIKGSPIAQIEQIGALLNIGSIPDFVYAKLGDGDILAGKALIQKAKDVHAEVKAFQTRLAGGKFFSDIDRQINETKSRIETLDKQAIRQNPVTETPSTTTETPSIQQEPASPPTDEQKLDDLKNGRIASFMYKTEAEVPDAFKDRITSRSTINGETTIRVSMPQSEADYLLNQSSQVEPDNDTTNDAVNDGVNDGVVDGVNSSPANLAETTNRQQTPESAEVLAEETVKQQEEPLSPETTKKLEDLSKEVTMKAQTASDLYLINRRIWGLNHEQAIETAVIQDRLVAEMARREGISKPEMYKLLDFKRNVLPPKNALYQIIGESARLARQVMSYLGLAQRAEKAGRTSSWIHQRYFWERGADKKWRYKINFGKLTVTPEMLQNMPKDALGDSVTTLSEIYNAPELFDAYPQLRDVQVVFNKSVPAGNGMYTDRGIHLSHDQVGFSDTDTLPLTYGQPQKPPTSLISVLVHEIQHVVQDIEGFATGGNPSLFSKNEAYSDYKRNVLDGIFKNERLKQSYRSLNDARNALMSYLIEDVNKGIADDSSITPILDDIDKMFNTSIYAGDRSDFNDNLMSDIYDLLAERGIKDNDRLTDIVAKEFSKFEDAAKEMLNSETLSEIHNEELDKLDNRPTSAGEYYRRLAGEVEARAAQKMLGRTPEEIQQTRLIDLYDVHPDHQIYRFDGGTLFQKDPDSAARGAMAFQTDGVAVMYALTDPNVSTPVHELVHVFERYLSAEERSTVLAEAKHKEWTTETSEFFARGFERYLLEGEAPTPELQSTFEKFKKWLTDIYLGIRNSVIDTPISVRMQNLYASFLTDDQFHNATAKPRVFSSPDRLRGKINQTELDSLRKTIELSDIPPGQTQHIDDMIQEAYEKYVTENPILEGGVYSREEKLMQDALNGMPMDAPMQLALANVINKLKQAHLRDTQHLAIAKQQGDPKGVIRSISDGIDAIEDQLDMFTRALYKARSVAGRSLGIGSKLIDFNAFNEVNLRAKLGQYLGESGKTLSEADKAFIKDISSKIDQEVKEIAALDIKDQQGSVKTKTIIAESQISQIKKAKMAKRTQSVLAAKANLDKILKGNIC